METAAAEVTAPTVESASTENSEENAPTEESAAAEDSGTTGETGQDTRQRSNEERR